MNDYIVLEIEELILELLPVDSVEYSFKELSLKITIGDRKELTLAIRNLLIKGKIIPTFNRAGIKKYCLRTHPLSIKEQIFYSLDSPKTADQVAEDTGLTLKQASNHLFHLQRQALVRHATTQEIGDSPAGTKKHYMQATAIFPQKQKKKTPAGQPKAQKPPKAAKKPAPKKSADKAPVQDAKTDTQRLLDEINKSVDHTRHLLQQLASL